MCDTEIIQHTNHTSETVTKLEVNTEVDTNDLLVALSLITLRVANIVPSTLSSMVTEYNNNRVKSALSVIATISENENLITKRAELLLPIAESYLFVKFIYGVDEFDSEIDYLLQTVVGYDVQSKGTDLFFSLIDKFIRTLKNDREDRLYKLRKLNIISNKVLERYTNARYREEDDNRLFYNYYLKDLENYLKHYIVMTCKLDLRFSVDINLIPYYYNNINKNGTRIINASKNNEGILSGLIEKHNLKIIKAVKDADSLNTGVAEAKLEEAYKKIKTAIEDAYKEINL